MSWTKPWAPGLAQEECAACSTRCVAATLAADGRCRHCVAHDRPVAAPDAEPVQLGLGIE